jgi:hypothetical protein
MSRRISEYFSHVSCLRWDYVRTIYKSAVRTTSLTTVAADWLHYVVFE